MKTPRSLPQGRAVDRAASALTLATLATFAAFATVATLGLGACGGGEALYPPRPPSTPGEAIADPAPSRVVMHTTVTSAGLAKALDETVPQTGEGTFPMLGKDRRYTWRRGPIGLKFDRGRIGLSLHVDANADLPISSLDVPLDFAIQAEPVVTSEYVAKLQSLDVKVSSQGKLVRAVDKLADVLPKLQHEIETKLLAFSYDLRPTLGESFQRIARPIPLPLGDAKGCAYLKVLGVEAGPLVMADGLERDLAMVVAPSVTIPCAVDDKPQALPPLANVATLQPGPFTVSIPIAARYDELAKAMGLAFTDGKLFFSKEYPELYLSNPEIYAAADRIVLKLHLGGPVKKYGIGLQLNGDLFMTGHPVVVDNELRVPDLEPTVETTSFLVNLKARLDASNIRDQARAALRLDLSERLAPVKQKLSTDLAFGNGQGCVKAEADKIEVSGVHVHAQYLRVYVGITGRASVSMPCPTGGGGASASFVAQ
ncbi:MAG: DUF4403 family protein [Myxococcales bacterium]|jgi:hypothetical protein|nr:DUF4403 family protein [Myxococcales bacterium]